MPLSGACALPPYPYLGLENSDIVNITNHPWEVTNGVITPLIKVKDNLLPIYTANCRGYDSIYSDPKKPIIL